MKIGIDLDGVVLDSAKEFRIYSELFDIIGLKRNSKIDNGLLRYEDRFDWTQEETEQFLKKYHKQITDEANFMPGAKTVLNLLKKRWT